MSGRANALKCGWQQRGFARACGFRQAGLWGYCNRPRIAGAKKLSAL